MWQKHSNLSAIAADGIAAVVAMRLQPAGLNEASRPMCRSVENE